MSFEQLKLRIAEAMSWFDPYYRAIAVGVAISLGAFVTLSAWDFARTAAEDEARVRFQFRAEQIGEAIRGRMSDYEQVLRGGVGLFAASTTVDRHEWRTYVDHLRIQQIYPGIQGIGFVRRVTAGARERHERAVNAEQTGRYAIQPAGDRPEYFPIDFIEPFSGRNLRAFGFDMYSEETRRAAMDRARDSGDPSVSGRLTLVQETDQDVQVGVLMFAPVYRNDLDSSSVARRRSALIGYIYGAFRMKDLMSGMLGKLPEVRLELFDSNGAGQPDLLFDSAPQGAASAPAFSSVALLPVRGRVWIARVTSLPAFEATVDRHTPRTVAMGTGLISILALAIIWSLATMRARATRLAASMTRELRESRERLALAIEGSNQALFDWDIRTGKVVLSEQWSGIIGAGQGGGAVETTMEGLQALVHPDDAEGVREQVRDLVRGTRIFYRAEHRVRTAAGGWRWVSSRAKVVERGAGGRAIRVAGTNTDITERKEIERLKNEFVATVSHELRTPLTAIVGALGLFKELTAGKLDADAQMFFSMAQQNSDRLATLINDILDIEKVESGSADFRADPVAIPGLLERAVELNSAYGEKFDVRFDLKRPVPGATVTGDADRLIQVITNLMSNAAKFSPAGSAVTVSGEIRDDKVRVSVADRGPGIPEEFRGRIFEKFAQADASDTRRKGGTGLGLAISRAIVEKMDGTMGFDSKPGEGATFWFELPLQSRESGSV